MRNYIKAELYRNFNRVYFWGMTLGVAAFALFGVIMIKIGFTNGVSYNMLFEFGVQNLILPVFLVSMIIEMVTSEEIKNKTLKNVVSFGFSRNKLVLSKLMVSVILSIISAIIILAVYFGSGAILFGSGPDFSLSIVKDFGLRLLAAVPLWIGAISVGNFLSFVIKNNTAFAFTYAGIFVAFRTFIRIVSKMVDKFSFIYERLITVQLIEKLGNTATITNNDLLFAVRVGVMYIIVFTVLSLIYFKKAEIK